MNRKLHESTDSRSMSPFLGLRWGSLCAFYSSPASSIWRKRNRRLRRTDSQQTESDPVGNDIHVVEAASAERIKEGFCVFRGEAVAFLEENRVSVVECCTDRFRAIVVDRNAECVI